MSRAADAEGEQPVTAIVLIRADSARIPEIGARIADVPGVAEAYTVAGEYDFVAVIRASSHEELVGAVTGAISGLPGVQRTQTLIAFKRYSRNDLSRMWSLGLEAGEAPPDPRA